MRKRDYVISEFALILARTAAAQWLFYFAVVQSNVERASLNGFAIFAFFSISHIILRQLIKHNVNLAVFVAGVIVSAAVLMFIAKYIFILEPFDPDANITVHVVLCAVALANGEMAYKDNPADSVIGKFDLLVILVTAMLFLTQLNKDLVVSGVLAWCLAAMAFIVAASAYSKASAGKVSGRGGEAAGKIGVAVLLAAVCTIAGVIIGKVQDGSRRFTEAVLEGLKTVFFGIAKGIGYICTLVYRFFLWLGSFGSGEEEMPLPPAEDPKPEIPMAIEEIETAAPLWFKILLGIAAIAVVVLVFRALSKIKTGRMESVLPSDNVKRESLFGKKLKALWSSFKDKMAYALFCISKRNTVPGLLSYCEKKALGKLKRRPSESGEKFLRRLAESASEEDNKTLLELADLCEKHYYSAEKQFAGKEICMAVRRLTFAKAM